MQPEIVTASKNGVELDRERATDNLATLIETGEGSTELPVEPLLPDDASPDPAQAKDTDKKASTEEKAPAEAGGVPLPEGQLSLSALAKAAPSRLYLRLKREQMDETERLIRP